MDKSRQKGKAGRGSSKRSGCRTGDAVGGDETHKRPWQQEGSDSSGNIDLFDWAQPYKLTCKTSTTVKTCDRGRGGKTAAAGEIRVGAVDAVIGDEPHNPRQQEGCDSSSNVDLFDWDQPYPCKTSTTVKTCDRGRGGKTAAVAGIRVRAGDAIIGDEPHKRPRQQEGSDSSGNVDLLNFDQPSKTSAVFKSYGKEKGVIAEASGGIRGGAEEGTSGGSSEGSFEEHNCNLIENCTDRHETRTPYLWRVKINGQWIRLAKENSTIEKAFCDPNVEEFWDVESIPGVAICLNFTTMQAPDLGPIQRLSTPSYVKRRKQQDNTLWQWYWHDTKTPQPWNQYGQNKEAPYQDVLEMKFLHDPRQIYRFELNRRTYELDFTTLEQRNKGTNCGRRIRRRPIYFEDIDTKKPWNEYHCDLNKLPAGWVPMDTESKHGAELIPFSRDNENYKTVSGYFFATMDAKKFEIKQILGVQNLELWSSYTTKKTNMEKFGGQAGEVGVFHGTPKEETVRWICSLGFDQRMNGTHGTKFGKGAYFATAASYSHQFTHPTGIAGLRSMFYAGVLVGQKIEGKSEYRRPPPIDPRDPKRGLYDTCVDNVANPNIFVVFDNNQSYPGYLIEYRETVATVGGKIGT